MGLNNDVKQMSLQWETVYPSFYVQTIASYVIDNSSACHAFLNSYFYAPFSYFIKGHKMKNNKLVTLLLPISLAVLSNLHTGAALAGQHGKNATNPDVIMQLPVLGTSMGDVDANSAVLWARTEHAGYMHVWYQNSLQERAKHKVIKVTAERDNIGKVKLGNLRPGTEYNYKLWFSNDKGHHAAPDNAYMGQFTTAPKAQEAAAISLAWGGDLAGQNVCRDVNEGFPIFNAINAMELDFFIGLGDMIYADGTCEAVGRYGNAQIAGDYIKAADMENYWAHWKYNQTDPAFKQLLSSTPYFAIWDDHEVVNDFGPLHDTRSSAPYTAGEHMLPKGLQAFLDYNPVDEDSEQPSRLYRTIRWGKHFELFVLDTRQYRDANSTNDDALITKTMLGREQMTWLKAKLKSSDATWKMIVSSVPISIPTGWPPENGRDGWADYDQQGGFEYELMDLFKFMRDEGINKSIWMTTDVHFASAFKYTPFAESPDFEVYEYVTGPLNAGLFPNQNYDTTMGTERLFFYGPSENVTEFSEARQWMNYGALRINEEGVLTVSIRDVDGEVLFEQEIQQ